MNQFVKFIQRDEHTQRLVMINLTSAQNSLSQMQEYFSLIASDFGYTPQSIDLCYQENLSLSYLKMCCEYYIAHMPNAHFRKYDIKPWYDEHCQDIRKSAENTLKGLADEYSVHFPYHTYSSGILSYYPIIIEGLTETLISNPADWIQRLIPFAKAPFDYLVVLLLDVSNKIMNHALLFSKSLFTELYDLTNGKESASTRITPPCPIAVTEQMIECFAHEYSLVDQIDDYGTMQCVTDIAEALWAYSKNRELLSEPEDSEYLANTQHRIVELVKNKMLALGKVLHTEMVSWLEDRIWEVYSGKTCNDVMFNSIIHHYSNFQK